MAIELKVNPYDPEQDFEVDSKHLERISFSDIKVRDVIKVTHGDHWGWDYRHISEVKIHPTEPRRNCAIGTGYRVGTGIGGCTISADRDWLLERVEMHTAYRLLMHYRQNWAIPEIKLANDPRTIDI